MVPEHSELAVLRALGSTVRQAILEQLGQGPATSAMLARALDSNTGVTSYHLRELAKAGLVERDVTRGRAQYWRTVAGDVRFRDPQDSSAPALAQSVIDLRLAGLAASVDGYLRRDDLSPAWRDAALFSQATLTLAPEELAELARAYLELVGHWTDAARDRSAVADHRAVRLALFAFPTDGTAPDPKE
ncbi:winged helix-turn-helix domain-containing protein [Nocardioides bizhenqiangii]|uniref:Winged helix-turn-helix domain-containing protein n=1 Tax=Nocardioides bizhenqiangii TaxID=3095076 RepID=A0ABZ0ZN24_9ACTN|nr:winged helix-turn-helix domain-containing protein [Nocardioides sp. HM61]WQQ25171.1 winged helix-turn-helix domain-containing protein [Nocardioides sp. HM61]